MHYPRKYSFQLLNARSVRNKVYFITQSIIDYNCSISAITETWLTLMILNYCLLIGLHQVNITKTQHMNINSNKMVKSIDGEVLKNVDNFIYLGSEIESTDKEIKIRIAKSWAVLDKLSSIWKSPLSTTLNRNFFRAVVESILLYGSEAWTLTKQHEKKLDGTYTRMLRAILNISWKEQLTKIRLYGNIPPLTSIIRIRRIRFVGHWYRSE